MVPIIAQSQLFSFGGGGGGGGRYVVVILVSRKKAKLGLDFQNEFEEAVPLKITGESFHNTCRSA